MPSIHAITTVTADATTLGDVSAWVTLASRLGASGSEELLDGGHLQVEGYAPLAGDTPMRELRLGDVEAWLSAAAAAGVGPEARITQGGNELAIDLHVHSVEPIGCGDCNDPESSHDVLVTTHLCTRV